MTRRAQWTAFALLLAFGLLPLRGTEALAFSGDALLKRCADPGSEAQGAYCEGYLESLLAAGHAEMIYLRSGCSTSKCRVDTGDEGRGQLSGKEWCLPEDVTSSALLARLMATLSADLVGRQAPAPLVVAEFLSDAWPCRE
jgi:hypothetical protein